MARACGLVVNPVNGRIGEVNFDRKDSSVTLYGLDGAVIAQGALDDGSYGAKYTLPAELSGYPRVHTNPGVEAPFRAEKGWGTCLYAGAALTAYLGMNSKVPLDKVSGDREGVCSDSNSRSTSASRWWHAAREAYGLAVEENVCGAAGEQERTIQSGEVGRKARMIVEEAIQSTVSETISDVSEWELTAKYSIEKCIDVDVLTYRAVDRAGLILSVGSGKETGGQSFVYLDEADLLRDFGDVSLPVMRAVNVGYLRGFGKTEGDDAMERLVRLTIHAGGTQADVDSMVERYNAGVDADQPRYVSPVVAHENPGTVYLRRALRNGRRVAVRATMPSALIARKVAPPKIVTYGRRSERNPPITRHVRDALAKVHEQRVRLGWGAFKGAL
jgi:hypothetical protein